MGRRNYRKHCSRRDVKCQCHWTAGGVRMIFELWMGEQDPDWLWYMTEIEKMMPR